MEIRYHGWSGISVDWGGSVVGFDLNEKFGVIGDRNPVLCVTHGHPDHCGLLQQTVQEGRTFDGTVVSTREVVEHFTGRGAIDRAVAAEETRTHQVDGLRISTFQWEHMPLLPPGIANKGKYLAHVLSRPLSALKIATTGLELPLFGPTIGFYVDPDEGPSILNYAEGLHRLTDPEEVASVADRFGDPDVLLSAIEPEDTEAVPRWIADLNPSRAFIFEAHRPWREEFGLDAVDLDEYAEYLSAELDGTEVESLVEPGVTFEV